MAVRTVHASAEFSFRLQDRAKKFQCRKMKPCIPIFFPAMCKVDIRWSLFMRLSLQGMETLFVSDFQ
ncbi:hypothetical protein ERO13_A08G142266v2 [Gossypium hirsutum]|uniref:Uncharacterized protein n=2 Tax=Gossypium TaxID=3633 RepID=A0A5D2YA18_GOSMU|nr:hypothetical protein ERO13_A08G142266v2 [Gossypium hirsutum]TYH06607.1 hypothetical protein ES288_A08G168300v1 [Gossypium darwinii]TYJ22953.1 hypothetical protein E1A91_A08G158800v1 [Gossypium mustelinum]